MTRPATLHHVALQPLLTLASSTLSPAPDDVGDLSLPVWSRLEVTVANMKHLEGRQLFRTRAGCFGYTKRDVKCCDLVFLITGLPVFHVLREAGEGSQGEQLWKIIGDAYLQGLMRGEVDEMDLDVEDVVLV